MSKFSNWVSHRVGNGLSMNGLKSSIKGTGKFAGEVGHYAAPIVAMANPLLGAGLAAGSDALRGKSIADMLKDAALTGGAGYALGHAGDAIGKVKGFFGSAGEAAGAGAAAGDVASTLGEDAAGEMARLGAGAGGAASAASAASAAGGAARGGVSGFLQNHPEAALSAAGHALGGVAQLSASSSQNKLERDRFNAEEDQRKRQNSYYDAQNAALNPVRQLLLQQMMRRLGLPTGG